MNNRKENQFEYPVIDLQETGKRIKELCGRKGITVKQLQEYLKVGAYQSIYGWFNGKSIPTTDNLLALSKLLKVPVEKLLVYEDKNRKAGHDWFEKEFYNIDENIRRLHYYGKIMLYNGFS